MGSRIAHRLLASGHDLLVWNRDAAKAEPLVEAGAHDVATPAEAAAEAEAVITMVADPAALRDVTEGPAGVAAGASDVTVVQMSTVGTEATTRLSSTLRPDTGLLDAPVLGSVTEAESGTLKIYVGGERSLVERWTPLLSSLGEVIHVGPVGAGSAAKLVANATLVGVIGVLGEALALGQHLGLTQATTFEVLDTTALAQQAERRRDSVETGRYPPRFALSLARKDADLILDAASDLDLRLMPAAQAWLRDAEKAGLAGEDYSAVLTRILGPSA
jgi:3-hydroxyisobutyrate dehydrogenase-like beta-hydroxyacid dehydrogenase